MVLMVSLDIVLNCLPDGLLNILMMVLMGPVDRQWNIILMILMG